MYLFIKIAKFISQQVLLQAHSEKFQQGGSYQVGIHFKIPAVKFLQRQSGAMESTPVIAHLALEYGRSNHAARSECWSRIILLKSPIPQISFSSIICLILFILYGYCKIVAYIVWIIITDRFVICR